MSVRKSLDKAFPDVDHLVIEDLGELDLKGGVSVTVQRPPEITSDHHYVASTLVLEDLYLGTGRFAYVLNHRLVSFESL